MRRREFLLGATGAAAATAVGSGAAVAQETATPTPTGPATGNATATGTPSGNATGTGTGAGGGGTVTVDLVDYEFDPGTKSPLVIPPGTTVKFVWKTGGHNIHVDSQPDGANWQGNENIEDAGYSTSFTFTVEGKYHFWCVPHKSLGMVGDIQVKKGASLPGAGGAAGGAPATVNPEELGVPFQAHYVGLATLLAMMIALTFTFFVLKYGESPNTGFPKR